MEDSTKKILHKLPPNAQTLELDIEALIKEKLSVEEGARAQRRHLNRIPEEEPTASSSVKP